MKIWLDAQLPPALALWIEATFGFSCTAIRDLGLRDAEDRAIFDAARAGGDVVILLAAGEAVIELGDRPEHGQSIESIETE